MQDRVVGCDVLRPDHARHLQFPQFVIDPEFLSRRDDQVAVGQDLGDDAGDVPRDVETFLAALPPLSR